MHGFVGNVEPSLPQIVILLQIEYYNFFSVDVIKLRLLDSITDSISCPSLPLPGMIGTDIPNKH